MENKKPPTMELMAFEDVIGHVIPIILAGVAVLLIIQSLFDRSGPEDEIEPDDKKRGGKGKEGGDEEPSTDSRDRPTVGEMPVVESVEEPQLLYDFSADLGDLDEDDPWEITMMSKVPDEILEKMEGKLADRSEEKKDRGDIEEFFLVSGVARSDRGQKRQVNEDAFLVIDDVPVFLVADGMGGYAGGDVASQLAVEVIERAFETHNFDGPVNTDWPLAGDELVRTFHQAHDAVREKKIQQPKYMDMGTTAVAVRFSEDKTKVYIANCGDSRCYRIRNEELLQLTTDHTLATLLGIKGKAGKKLTQAVGVHDAIAVDLSIDESVSGDYYLVCSDGLTKMLDDDAILKLTLENKELDAAAQALVDESNAQGGRDNITVIVIRVDENPGAIVDSPKAVT